MIFSHTLSSAKGLSLPIVFSENPGKQHGRATRFVMNAAERGVGGRGWCKDSQNFCLYYRNFNNKENQNSNVWAQTR